VRFARKILGHPDFAAGDIVWGFNSASLRLFESAQSLGRRCILEQTILPERLESQLLAEESQRWPGWDRRAAAGVPSAVPSVAPDEEAEWVLADRIVAGSEFVRDGLLQLGVPASKVRVVPYGVDAGRFRWTAAEPFESPSAARGPLRVLFAGEVGLRKGVPDLLEALHHLPVGAVEVRLAGAIALVEDKLRDLPACVQLLGPVPRPRMAELFRWAQVFVLPSIVEGSATTTYEALMSGVPVIATPNAGSPVRDGIDGVIVPIRNPRALADALQRYLDEPDVLYAHRAAAMRDRDRLGLDAYRENLVAVVRGLASE
jgi:glycosyltransferase involved in cell wall biosynthesis